MSMANIMFVRNEQCWIENSNDTTKTGCGKNWQTGVWFTWPTTSVEYFSCLLERKNVFVKVNFILFDISHANTHIWICITLLQINVAIISAFINWNTIASDRCENLRFAWLKEMIKLCTEQWLTMIFLNIRSKWNEKLQVSQCSLRRTKNLWKITWTWMSISPSLVSSSVFCLYYFHSIFDLAFRYVMLCLCSLYSTN